MYKRLSKRLIHELSVEATAANRRRKIHTLHSNSEEPVQRMLNAIEPGSYIRPHCHLSPLKCELILALTGRIGVVFFEPTGAVTQAIVLEPQGETFGVDIAPQIFHTVIALRPSSVILEVKAGPYRPLLSDEIAPWAPREDDLQVASYLDRIYKLFQP